MAYVLPIAQSTHSLSVSLIICSLQTLPVCSSVKSYHTHDYGLAHFEIARAQAHVRQ